jgi:thymidylate synthase (FAD)
MLPEHLRDFQTPIRVLDHGYILLIDVMGDDDAVVQAARVSYARGTKKSNSDKQLLRYLLRSGHTSPFEQAQIKLEIKLPIYVERQWARHRTASWNEVSGRYSELPNEMHTTEGHAFRVQSTDNKQGSGGYLTEWPTEISRPEFDGKKLPVGEYLSKQENWLHESAHWIYQERLDLGVAREQARCVLPVSTYTSKVWTIDLHNLLNFLRLRMDSHAQLEIRQYANALAEIVKSWVPWTWEAFEDYTLGSMTFSRQELLGISSLLNRCGSLTTTVEHSGLKGREAKEFKAKLVKLWGLDPRWGESLSEQPQVPKP